MEQIIEGLPFGEYRLIADGKVENALTILVEDVPQLQQFRLERWTSADIAAITAVCAFCVGLGILLIRLLKDKRMRNKEGG